MKTKNENTERKGMLQLSEDSIVEIFYAINPILITFAKRIVGNEDDADDIVAQAWGKIWLARHNHSFPNIAAFNGLMKTVVLNVARDHLRRKKTRHKNIGEFSSLQNDTEMPASVMQDWITTEVIAKLHKAVECLSGQLKRVTELRLDGCSTDKIAEIMDIEPSTARTYLMKARIALLKHLEKDFCLTASMIMVSLVAILMAN